MFPVVKELERSGAWGRVSREERSGDKVKRYAGAGSSDI